MKNKLFLLICVLYAFGCSKSKEKILAEQILADQSFHTVDSMARGVIASGFNAGDGYSQIWARDMNTFIETSCEVSDSKDLRGAILIFFALQQPNDEIVDGYVLKGEFTWYDPVSYTADAAPDHVGFKNTVETDQESSLIQIVGKYIDKTGDRSILTQDVAGRTVYKRMEDALDYLLRERYSEKYGLFYGAMTADWGDVQPNDDFGCDFNELSHKTIDMYDNAMLIIALDYMVKMSDDESHAQRWQSLRDSLAVNARKYLWDANLNKVIPHIYLEESPIDGFDENSIYYHGGTAIAIEAGLLSNSEIEIVNRQMVENVKNAGAMSIGLTLYPPYPDNFFRGGMSKAYIYQNGGDWTWFGGRMIQQLIRNGFVEEAYCEVRPMIDRVVKNKGFYEWYHNDGTPSGSGQFRGSAGTLAKSIEMFREWASLQK